jgi:2-polyprenyl-3-methyl-5-hydroxy-6-metoxy-1,4-benzoquinol methylase
MFNHTQCPVCKGINFKEHLKCKDYTVSQETFTIVECQTCSFKFTNPIPDLSHLGDYYKSEDYISHSDTKKGLISKIYHLVRSRTLKTKLSLVEKHVSRGTILDYGCGTGAFIKTCKDSGWGVYGMEPDSGARATASEQNLNVAENKSGLNGIKDQSLNAITLWHVLEHVTDLKDTLDFFWNKLNKQGVLIIAVPNHKGHDARYYKEYWAAYDVPRHLYHFERATMIRLLEISGFVLKETKPMKFDSFYVSMLSEKYKTGSINYLKAFLTGLKSNLSANISGEYSSLIYVFKKK